MRVRIISRGPSESVHVIRSSPCQGSSQSIFHMWELKPGNFSVAAIQIYFLKHSPEASSTVAVSCNCNSIRTSCEEYKMTFAFCRLAF